VWAGVTDTISEEVHPLPCSSNMKIALRFAYLNTGMWFAMINSHCTFYPVNIKEHIIYH
jgi:hypothetical protein